MELSEKVLVIANALNLVRTESGTVYRKNLVRICNREDPVSYINESCGIPFLMINDRTKGTQFHASDHDPVCTDVAHRFLLDLFLDKIFSSNIFRPVYYAFRYELLEQMGDKLKIRFYFPDDILLKFRKLTEKVKNDEFRQIFDSLLLEAEKGYTAEYNFPVFDNNTKGEFKKCFFSFEDIARLKQSTSSATLVKYDFSDSFFTSKVTFEQTVIQNGITFRGACFFEPVIFKNCIIEFNDNSDMEIDFRDTVFKNGAIFDSVKVRGSAKGEKITFEDAYFGNDFDIFNCDFGDTLLYCFQTIFDNVNFNITDSKLSDSEIDFLDAKVGKVLLRGIDSLPICKLNFYEAQSLVIQDCDIQNAMYIQNVNAFTLKNVSRLAPIISVENWTIDVEVTRKPKHSFERLSPKAHPLIKAGMNSENQADIPEQMLLLKENFHELGQYDAEDAAFLMYMRNRKVSKGSKFLFAILDVLGSFGISPLRTFVCLGILIILSFVFYTVHHFVSDCSNIATFGKILYQSFSNILSITGSEGDCVWCRTVELLQAYFGWFITGYFSIAIVRKTLR